MASGDTVAVTGNGADGKPASVQALEEKNDNLFAALQRLGTAQTDSESKETGALHDFASAESKLIEAGKAFSGPAPQFLAPTWDGSDDPKTASYRKAFEPIIRRALSELTVQQIEDQIVSDELQDDLKGIFQDSATELQVFTTTPSNPDPETLFLEWVADSVISTSSQLNPTRQKAIQNALIVKILASRDQLAQWQKSGFEAAWAAIVGTITTALQDPANKIDVTKETQTILSALNQGLKKLTPDQTSDEESIRAWIETCINNGIQGPELTEDKKEELIADLEDEVTQLFPQPDKISFYTTITTLLEQQLYDPPPKQPGSLSGRGSRAGSSQAPIDPSTAVANAKAASTALQEKVDAAKKDWETKAEELKNAPTTISRSARAKLVQAADAAKDTFDDLTIQWDQANIDLAEATAKEAENPLDAALLKDRIAAATDLVNDLQDQLDNAGDDTDEDTSNLTARLEAAKQNLDDLNNAASAARKNPDGGLKSLIDSFAADQHIPDPVKLEWQSRVKDEVRNAIRGVFLTLSEQGAQGRLLATTYDYQIVKRAAEHSRSALSQLATDLDTEIPDNAKLALTAAQNVTAASSSLREFVTFLDGVVEEFQAESGSGGKSGASGKNMTSYNLVASLVNGGPQAGRYSTKDLHGVGQALFLSKGHPGPAIKAAELQGVQLAAVAAGLKTTLSRLLDSEKTDALASLDSLSQSYSKLFQSEANTFTTAATDFFDSLTTYIDTRFAFENDQSDLTALRKATEELGDLMDKGVMNYLPGGPKNG